MPCLIFCGHPSSGKTELARIFRERALKHPNIEKVVVINEESACKMSKQDCYKDSLAEKKTRGSLKSNFDRAVAAADQKTLVILDSLNYIKGFRYELHCISKANNQNHGIVWVLNEVELAKEWNSKRDDKYDDALLHELVQRFEPPDSRNRWDSPLYRVDVRPESQKSDALAQSALKSSVYNMHKLSDAIDTQSDVPKPSIAAKVGFRRAKKVETKKQTEELEENQLTEVPKEVEPSVSLEERVDALLEAFLSSEPLKEGTSTRQHVAADSDLLNEVDSITYRILGLINQQQNKATSATSPLSLPFGEVTLSLKYGKQIGSSELKRLRQQYIHWVSGHPPEDSSSVGIAKSFLSYIEAQDLS